MGPSVPARARTRRSFCREGRARRASPGARPRQPRAAEPCLSRAVSVVIQGGVCCDPTAWGRAAARSRCKLDARQAPSGERARQPFAESLGQLCQEARSKKKGRWEGRRVCARASVGEPHPPGSPPPRANKTQSGTLTAGRESAHRSANERGCRRPRAPPAQPGPAGARSLYFLIGRSVLPAPRIGFSYGHF